MKYVRRILSAVAAVVLAVLAPGVVEGLRAVSAEKATGLAVVMGGAAQAIYSPWFWVLALVFFALFFAASSLSSRLLRVLLFWIPSVAVTVLGFSLAGVLAYLWVHVQRG